MDDIAIARAIHVFAVVVWIGGVAMVTTVILPVVRRGEKERLALLEAVERRFIWQARIATLLVAASGFYMVGRLDLWDRSHHRVLVDACNGAIVDDFHVDPFYWRAADAAESSPCAGSI